RVGKRFSDIRRVGPRPSPAKIRLPVRKTWSGRIQIDLRLWGPALRASSLTGRRMRRQTNRQHHHGSSYQSQTAFHAKFPFSAHAQQLSQWRGSRYTRIAVSWNIAERSAAEKPFVSFLN